MIQRTRVEKRKKLRYSRKEYEEMEKEQEIGKTENECL
jgi:hypothetical protein